MTQSILPRQGASSAKTRAAFVDTEKRNACVAHVPVGTLTIRNTHTPTLNRREKLSMLDVTSKIMSASVNILKLKAVLENLKTF